MPDWHEKGGHAFVLGARKERTITLRDVLTRGNQVMDYMEKQGRVSK